MRSQSTLVHLHSCKVGFVFAGCHHNGYNLSLQSLNTDTPSFLAIAAATQSMHGIAVCLSRTDDPDGSAAAAQCVQCLTNALRRPAELCRLLCVSEGLADTAVACTPATSTCDSTPGDTLSTTSKRQHGDSEQDDQEACAKRPRH